MSGLQEILLIIAIIVILLTLTRRSPAQGAPRRKGAFFRRPRLTLTGMLRLGIVASLIWPLLAVALFPPWRSGNLFPFFYFGIGPVILGWSIRWVVNGFQRHDPGRIHERPPQGGDDQRPGA